jgi:hypothetical protein
MFHVYDAYVTRLDAYDDGSQQGVAVLCKSGDAHLSR